MKLLDYKNILVVENLAVCLCSVPEIDIKWIVVVEIFIDLAVNLAVIGVGPAFESPAVDVRLNSEEGISLKV